jgi:hypothetical protein
MKKDFLKISEEVLELAQEYKDLENGDIIVDIFNNMFVVFLSTVKEAKEGSTEQELRETIYNIMFGEDNKLKTNGITFNNIDLELLNEIKSSIDDL